MHADPHIAERRIVLHTTDLTLLEVSRQIAENVESKIRERGKVEKSLRQWRHVATDIPATPPLEASAISTRLAQHFQRTLVYEWSATLHQAQSVPAIDVFRDYFARRPPFDRDGSKEFPDAFMIRSLDRWCAANGVQMHVVTRDAAMSRAVAASKWLIQIQTIEELLKRASVQPDLDVNVEEIAEEIVNAPGFDDELERVVANLGSDLVFEYHGDLAEAEVVGHRTDEIEAVTDYSVVWIGASSVCMFLTVNTEVAVEVQHEDRSLAMYDNEDGRWFGGEREHEELTDTIPLELFVEAELTTRRFVAAELLRTEYWISESRN